MQDNLTAAGYSSALLNKRKKKKLEAGSPLSHGYVAVAVKMLSVHRHSEDCPRRNKHSSSQSLNCVVPRSPKNGCQMLKRNTRGSRKE